MKYMTFNSSCAFAGVANLLAQYGVDTDDRAIALGMKLPFLFAKEGGSYLAGPMLQSAPWFNLFLNPIGFAMEETAVTRDAVPAALCRLSAAMLGLTLSPQNKHAVVYTGFKDGQFCFLNNKWQHTDEPEQLSYTADVLLSRLDAQVLLAVLTPVPAAQPNFTPLLEQSCRVLELLRQDLQAFCTVEQTSQAMRAAMNPLFRPLLLDSITMLELIGETEWGQALREQQTQLLNTIRAGNPARLSDRLSLRTLHDLINAYIGRIQKEAETWKSEHTPITTNRKSGISTTV